MRMNSSMNKAWDQYLPSEWQEHFADLSTGIRMCYLTMGPENGTPVMLIHGGLECRLSWYYIAPKLAADGYRLYIPELRGHGKTEGPISERGYYLIDEFADDLISLLDTLNLKQINIVGHSIGSLTAQLVTIRMPERVKTLTLHGSGVKTEAFPDDLTEDFFNEEWRCSWAQIGLDSPDMKTALLSYALQASPVMWKQILNGAKYFNSQEMLKTITCPVQIIWGTTDYAFPETEQKTLKESLCSASVRFVEMVGQEHSFHWTSFENIQALYEQISCFAKPCTP